MKKLTLLVILYILFFLIPLSVTGEEVSSDKPKAYLTYIVEEGDNLHSIAAKHYNNARLWKIIYRVNKAVIKNPNILQPGQELIIPMLGEDDEVF